VQGNVEIYRSGAGKFRELERGCREGRELERWCRKKVES
jgi:hypothetical protein